MLLPARLNTHYLTDMLTSGACSAAHLWLTRVTFLPFQQPLSATMVTLLFGEKWKAPRHRPATRRVPCDVWDISPAADAKALLRCARAAFPGPVQPAPVHRLPKQGICLVVLDRDFAAGVRVVASHCRAHRACTVLLVTLTMLHSGYMRAVQDLIRGLVLYRPRLHLRGVETIASSHMLVMGAAVRWTQVKRVCPVYLADPGVAVLTDT